MTQAQMDYALAPRGRRIAAVSVDAGLVVAGGAAGAVLGSLVLAGVLAAEVALLCWGLQVRLGASPGQALAKIRVADAARPWTIGLGRGLVRGAVTLGGAAAAGIGLWLVAALVTRDGVGLDDRASKSRTVLVPAGRPSRRRGRAPDAVTRHTQASVAEVILTVDTGQVHRLTVPGRYVVGRGPMGRSGAGDQCVILHDPGQSISRVHARIQVEAHGLVVTDLGSTNGCAVSDGSVWHGLQPHQPATVAWGTLVAVGQRVIRVDPVAPR